MILNNVLFLMCFIYVIYSSNALNLPGPRIYVVTPATKLKNEGRSAPFYYQNWMRRMDPPKNATTTTTLKPKTHDLIFAEFESDKGNNLRNSIRKLLEKEKLNITTSTTITPSIPDMDETHNMNGEVHSSKQESDNSYESMYPNLSSNLPAPIYLSSTTSRPPSTTSRPPATKQTTKSTDAMDVKNIWHIIDEQNKYNQYSGKWEEEDLSVDSSKHKQEETVNNKAVDMFDMDNNFALPGINPTPTSATENESRAIRTEANVNFPYVNLKTMQMKRPYMDMSQINKKGQPTYTNLDNFRDVKYPVKGEAQDVVPEQVDRYNSGIPYFQTSNKNSKQSSKPVKSYGSLVPPPPPPKSAGSFFPPPNTYESFPPYPPTFSATSGPPAKPPPSLYRPPPPPTDDSDLPSIDSDDSDSPPIDSDDSDGPPSGYQHSPPTFLPTVAPPAVSMSKPFTGYSYEKPHVDDDSPPMKGYSYPKPPAAKPPADFPNLNFDHDHNDHREHPPHDTEDYPDLIHNKHKGNEDDDKDGSEDDMVPPPPPDMKDHGFPHDFPGYSVDDDDFYHDHHHYHHPTTTTTETPRVNRYSYYYLGKKLYYIPLYFSAYFVAYVASLVIKSVLRHKIVYPNSYKTNEHSATFFSKRSIRSTETGSWNFSDEKLHEVTRIVSDALYNAAEKYLNSKM